MFRPCEVKPGINQTCTSSPLLNDILPRLNNVRYMSIIDTSSGYHDLKLDEKLLYLTSFACPFGRWWYK